MERRTLGRTGIEVGVIGLGTEHLIPDPVNIERVLAMAVDAGVDFVDLLYVEPDYWDHYAAVYRRYRDRLIVAAHWGNGPCHDMDFCQSTFADVLERGCGGYADVAMMTMIDDEKRWREWGQRSIEQLVAYRERGQIGAIGMSGHEPKVAQMAVEAGLIDVLMFGVNMVTHGDPALDALLDACQRQGVGVVAMKPFWGGPLLTLDGRSTGITPSQCLRYTLDQAVATTVPGIRDPQELAATLAFLVTTPAEQDYAGALAGLRETLRGHCTYCSHCMPCPEGIDIANTIMTVDWAHDGVHDELRNMYAALPEPASTCTACGICVERCPFAVDIIDKMEHAVRLYEGA